jgi:hypothetical protein
MPAATVAPPKDERRIAQRLKPALGTVCKIETDDGKPRVGLVWNISLTGISLLLGQPPKPKDILAAELALDDGKTTLPVIFTVIHVKPTPTGDYLVGAQFLRSLTDEEIAMFTAPQG